MSHIYRVVLGGIHSVKDTLDYEEAKAHFLIWVEELTHENVSYKTVTLTKDHEPVLEYMKK